jgi:hypothetical protein
MHDVGLVATINATISSILLAAVSLWAASVIGELASQKRRILETANRVNQLPFLGSMGGVEVKNDLDSVRKMLMDLVKVGMGVGPNAFKSNLATRGGEFMRLMTSVAGHYPFPCRIQAADQGGVAIGKLEPVDFNGIEDVAKWVNAAESLTGQVEWLFRAHRGKVTELISAVDADFSPHRGPDLESLAQHLSPGALSDIAQYTKDSPGIAGPLADRFLMNVGALAGISTQTRELLQQRQAYLGRSRWRGWLLLLALLSLVSLLSGAVIPMLFPCVSNIVYVWVPGVIYLASGFAGFVALARAVKWD